MDRGARGERGEREGREPDSFCRCKMRFQKTRPVFPCAAHANSFTRVPGRNAAGWGWLGMAGDGWGWLGMAGDGWGREVMGGIATGSYVTVSGLV